MSTTLGAEGLDVVDGTHLLIADTPDAFASACLRLAQDESLRRRMADAARQLQMSEYSLEALISRFAPAADAPRHEPGTSFRET